MLVGALTHVKACRGNLETHNPAAVGNSSSSTSHIGCPRRSPTPAHAVWPMPRPTPVPGQNNLRLSLAALKKPRLPHVYVYMGHRRAGKQSHVRRRSVLPGLTGREHHVYIIQTHWTHGPVHPDRLPARTRRPRHNVLGSTTPSNPASGRTHRVPEEPP